MTDTRPPAAQLASGLRDAATHIEENEPVSARDWAAFLQKLADLFKQLAPIILPLILKEEPKQ